MPPSTDFVRALESHRAHTIARRPSTPERPSIPLLLSWIHHDNMLEGRRYKTAEIVQALRNRDDEVDRYLHPLMQEIRRYADAICFAWEKSNEGCCQVNIDNLKRLHRLITPDPEIGVVCIEKHHLYIEIIFNPFVSRIAFRTISSV